MTRDVYHFTRGFNAVKHDEKELLPTSITFLRRFIDKGYYVFIENRLMDYVISSGKFNNAQALKFFSVGDGNYLYRAEVAIESIHMEINTYEVVLSHRTDKSIHPIIISGSVSVEN